jgi:hypothetical protein
MFGLTKKDSQNQENNKTDALNLNQQKDFNIEDMPIHTMKEDLENPDAQHGMTMPGSAAPTPNQAPFSQKQKDSPFFNLDSGNSSGLGNTINKNPLNAVASRETNREEKSLSPFAQTKNNLEATSSINTTNYKDTPSMTKDYSVFHLNWRMVFFSTFSLILIIVLSWVGFNYSQDKNYNPLKKTVKNTETKQNQPIETTPEDPNQKPILSYSETNPNYLRMEDANLDADKMKTVLMQYMKKVSQEGYKVPVEFIVTNAQNKPIGFKAFSSLLGLKFSPALLALLGENFTLFIHDDTPAPRIGLAIESKDDINLVKVLLQEEKMLADEISPILFTNDYSKTKPFESTEYAGAKIRYQNIISPDNLSVDHSVYKNKLIIGTTKATMQALINHFNKTPTK